MEARIRQILTFILGVAGMMLLYGVLDTQGMLKYVILVLVGTFILIINYNKLDTLKEDWEIILPVVIYCGSGLLFSMCGGTKNAWTIKNVVFVVFPLMYAYVLCLPFVNKRKYLVDITFWGCVFAYLYCSRFYFQRMGYCESTFAFVFGLFILYYLWNKQLLNVVIAAMCMCLAHKRIAVLAVVVCVGLMLVMKFLKYKKKWIISFWSMLMIMIGGYIYSIYSGCFMDICVKIGVETKNRLDVYHMIADQIQRKCLLGRGLGTTNAILAEKLDSGLITWFENPHNDFLKMLIDVGAIGLTLFLASYLVVFYIAWKKEIKKQALSQLFVVYVYFMLLMTTDNVSIYVLFLIPMYSVCLALMEEKEEFHENHAK